MPFGIQPIHIVIIIGVAFLIFGGNKLPELGRSAGKAISEFKKGTKEMTDGFREEVGQAGTPAAAAASFQSPTLPIRPVPNNPVPGSPCRLRWTVLHTMRCPEPSWGTLLQQLRDETPRN